MPLALDFDPLEYCPFGICPLLKSLVFTYQPLWVLVLGRVCWCLALKAVSCILLHTGSLIILAEIPARKVGLTMHVGVGILVWKAVWLGKFMVVCLFSVIGVGPPCQRSCLGQSHLSHTHIYSQPSWNVPKISLASSAADQASPPQPCVGWCLNVRADDYDDDDDDEACKMMRTWNNDYWVNVCNL